MQSEGKRLPHYALRTVSSSAPEYANHEQDIIRQSFRTGNHTWIKEALPVDLGPDAVNLRRRRRMEQGQLPSARQQPLSKLANLLGNSNGQDFEFMPDEYDRERDMARDHKREAVEKRLARQDWKYTSQERKMKHEQMISDSVDKDVYPYLGGKYSVVQMATWLRGPAGASVTGEDGTQTCAPECQSFVAGRGCGLEDRGRSSRMQLPVIISRLQQWVQADWEGCTIVISPTEQDLIQIAFRMDTVDSERGVLAYMSVLAKDIDLLGSLGVRRVSQLWGMKRDFVPEDADNDEQVSWMFFLFMPKWVHMRPTDAFYTVRPRSQGSAFRMSTAGSSVLVSLGSTVVDSSSGDVPKRKGSSRQGKKATSARAPRVDVTIIEKALSAKQGLHDLGSAR